MLIVVIDTLRADRLGAYGNMRGLTPFLDALARRGTLFERTYASSSWTVPSVASLFTSRYPSQHHVVSFGSVLADEEVTLAERLRDAGWILGGFSANPNLRTDRGFAQGFDLLWSDLSGAKEKVPGDKLRAEALAWLHGARNRRAGAPAALYLQLMEPHEPYEPREPFRSRFAVDDDGESLDTERALREVVATVLPEGWRRSDGKPADLADVLRHVEARGTPLKVGEIAPFIRLNERRYDAEVAEADDQVRRLFDELERHGFLENVVVVVTSDHGEEFLEHGRTSHGRTLYEESVRVPLILVGPSIPTGRRVSDRVSLLDLAPTLLDLLHLPPAQEFEGRSLLPLMRAAPITPGDMAATPDILLQLECVLPGRMDNRVHSRALVRGDGKLLVGLDGSTELFDLAADPVETRSRPIGLAEQEPALHNRLSLADTLLGERAGRVLPPAPVDQALRERLRALGYTP